MKGAVSWLRAVWGKARRNAADLAQAEKDAAARVQSVVLQYQRAFVRAPLVLADLAHLCHATRSSIEADPHATSFNEGKRAVWLHIAEMLSLKPEDYVPIVQEIETHD